VGSGPGFATTLSKAALDSLPARSQTSRAPVAAAASDYVWGIPKLTAIVIPSNVASYDPGLTPTVASAMAYNLAGDLNIEAEARRSHDLKLAASVADADALTEFTDVIKQDIAAKKIIQKTYSFDQISLQLFLPKFASQAARLVGVTVHGTATFTTMDSSGNVLSKTSAPYTKTWGVHDFQDGSPNLIYVDYTGLALAP